MKEVEKVLGTEQVIARERHFILLFLVLRKVEKNFAMRVEGEAVIFPILRRALDLDNY